MSNKSIQIPEPAISRFFFADTRFSFFWLLVRLYVGWQWLAAGWEKIGSPSWTGDQAGTAVKGFLNGALSKMTGPHPDVSGWYGYLIDKIALPHVAFISHLVAYVELIVGAALILGIFTGIAAFAGSFMNLNYLFAGTVSINPLLLMLQLFLILAWRNSGWLGIDRYLLPLLGTPWSPGKIFK